MDLTIYIVDTNEIDISQFLNSPLLTEEDKESFSTYKNETVKKEKVVSTYLKRRFVESWSINKNGKPISDNLFFNISHSHGLVAFVSSNKYPIGIDVELIKEAKDDLINYVSSKEEKEYIKSDKDFFKVWTNKEALVKAIGTGINCKVNEIPGLFFNQSFIFKNKEYQNRMIEYGDYIIAINVETKEQDINIELVELFK